MSWDEISMLINKEFREDESLYRTEAAYRKGYSQAKKYFESGVFNHLDEETYFKELQLKKQEVRKERQKLFDERTGLNKILREQARKESLFDMIKRAMSESVIQKFSYAPNNVSISDSDMIVHCTDIHAGLETYSAFNSYNSEILKCRMQQFLNEIVDISKEQHTQNCYLILGGDMLNGLIHINSRIENKENVVEQIKLVSEIMSGFTMELSKYFKELYVYSTPGNHSRATANKDEHIKGENFDALIPFYVSLALQNIKNVHVVENTLDEGICTFCVRGHHVFGAHGDKDTVSNVVYNMTKFARKAKMPLPDIVFLGHRHTNGLTTVDDVKVIQGGCVDGMDNYSIDKRLIGSPEQMVAIVTEQKRIKALYDIQLD